MSEKLQVTYGERERESARDNILKTKKSLMIRMSFVFSFVS